MVILQLQVMELGASRQNCLSQKKSPSISITLNADSVTPNVHVNLVLYVNDV